MIATRLVAYAPGGDVPLGHLPEPLSWQCSLPHNDVGALALKYSTLAARGDLLGRGLAEGLDVALWVDFGSGWIEPDGGRFLLRTRSRNLAGTDGVLDLTLPSYGALLADMRILALELLEVGGEFDGQRLFTAVNAGKILRPLLDEYASRHAQASALTWSFTASLDSALVAWPSTEWAIPYQAGVDLRSVLGSEQTAGLTSLGLVDWRTRGRELMAWVKDSQFVDRSALVRLELSRDIRDAPLTETLDGTAGYTLVRGEGSVIATVISEDAPSPWGVAEAYLTASGATSVEAAQEMVALEVERRARETAEYTQQLTLDPDGVLPLRDYLPGDVISAPASGGRRAMRVQQVTLSMDGGELTGSVVLNDRMVPADLRVAGRLRAITGGSAAGGTGVVPVPARPIPKAPTGLSLSTNAWWNYGTARATVGASWSAVTESTEGKPILISSYRIRVTPVGFEGSAQSTSAVVDDLPTGVTVQVQVAAVSDLGVQGQWSNVAGISTAVPPDTLVPPTVLALSTGDGTVRAVWDGKLQAPPAAVQDPPGHFDRVIVQAAAAAGGPWSTQGSIHTAGGRWIIPGTVGATVYVRGIAVDRAGNQTGPGPVASIVVTSWVTDAVDDLQTAADDAMAAATAAQTTADGKNRIVASETTPATPDGGWVAGDQWYKLNADQNTISVQIWNGGNFVPNRFVADSVLVPSSIGAVSIDNGAVTAPKLFVNQAMIDALAVDSLWVGKAKGTWLSFDAIDGKTITGAIFRTTATVNRGIKIDTTGLKAFNAGGTATLTIDAATGAISMLGSLTSGSTIIGATVTGGTVQTDAAADRGVKLVGAGLIAYNASGVQTVRIDGSTGNLTVVGGTISGTAITGSTITGTTIIGGVIATKTGPSSVVMADNMLYTLQPNGIFGARLSPYYGILGSPGATLSFFNANGTSNTDYSYGRIVHYDDGGVDYSKIFFEDALYLDGITGVKINDPDTNSHSANAYLWNDSGGYRKLVRSTSVRAAKRLIQDAALSVPMVAGKQGKLGKEQQPASPAGFLALRPRTWFDRADMAAAGLDPDTATEEECLAAGLRRIPGFIAEEVEQVDPTYAIYERDKDGGPVLTGVAYDRLSAAIHPVLVDHDTRLADLTARLEAIESPRSPMKVRHP